MSGGVRGGGGDPAPYSILKSAQLGNKSDCAIRLRNTWHDKLSR